MELRKRMLFWDSVICFLFFLCVVHSYASDNLSNSSSINNNTKAIVHKQNQTYMPIKILSMFELSGFGNMRPAKELIVNFLNKITVCCYKSKFVFRFTKFTGVEIGMFVSIGGQCSPIPIVVIFVKYLRNEIFHTN